MKIAFCLVGVVGAMEAKHGQGTPVDYRIGHHFHNKHIFEPNKEHDIDVFIHSWSTDFKDELVDIYKPKKYIIENQIDFNQPSLRLNSIASRWYSTAMSVQLKKVYEEENNFKYDIVMLYRFDHIFQTDLKFSKFEPEYFYTSHRDDCTENLCKCDIECRYYDAWFFSNSHYMDSFSELYNSWEEYNIKNPHAECVHHLYTLGLKDKIRHILSEKIDHFTIRSRIKNCGYEPNKEFDINKLEFFDSHNLERHRW